MSPIGADTKLVCGPTITPYEMSGQKPGNMSGLLVARPVRRRREGGRMTDDSCAVGSEHAWEFCIADEGRGIGGGTPYHFCRKCKKTLFNGRIYGIRPEAK